MEQAKLKIVGGAKAFGDDELRLWLDGFIKEHEHLPTIVLARADHIGASRTALDAYIDGTYFLPKPQGSGVKPEKSKLEDKIRAYREKVEGTVRHGFTNSFLETRNWNQFQYACKTAIEEKVIVVVYGKPGLGKSRCLQEYKTTKMTTMPIDILCSANITTRYFVQKIAREVGVDDKHPTAKLEDMVAEKLNKNVPRLLFVDQANYLNEKGLGTICYLWEKTRVPIVLLGTKDLFDLFMTSNLTQDVRAQLSSRVAWHCPLMELSIDEVKTICKRALGENATDEAVMTLFNLTGGNHRHLDMIVPRVRQLANRNEANLLNGSVSMKNIVEKASSRIMVG